MSSSLHRQATHHAARATQLRHRALALLDAAHEHDAAAHRIAELLLSSLYAALHPSAPILDPTPDLRTPGERQFDHAERLWEAAHHPLLGSPGWRPPQP